ncbi:hypothetical protein [Mycobacterium sp. 852002-10029_SCH5224772]|uniref:hypothetical protein n=1 Tax=Mycobacterium sp. 852002-10029_SCH5224772 TaxID=1834083 RepID=UPI0018D3BEDF|nr:hypothetical protein [Mycobacterium sp. 852002-10029_SCH5224772]
MNFDEPAPQRVRGHQAGCDGLATDERLSHGGSVPQSPDKLVERALSAKISAEIRRGCTFGEKEGEKSAEKPP